MKTIVFLGPSLRVREARRLLRASYRPPARQGDVFAALEERPDVIVLIDGVFEAAPSVWHHELLAAHDAGVHLFGACSMGALRAAELPGVVKPLGLIARKYARGEWNDDAYVALLHGDAASGFRPLSVPWVNVWATARAALSAREAKHVCEVAEGLFYQARTWPRLFDALHWSPAQRAHFTARLVDQKADDARTALKSVAQRSFKRRAPRPSALSSFVRRTRLAARPLPVARRRDFPALEALLLAQLAQTAGLEPEEARLARHRARLKTSSGDDQLETWARALALHELVLEAPEYFLNDGPSPLEARALLHALKR